VQEIVPIRLSGQLSFSNLFYHQVSEEMGNEEVFLQKITVQTVMRVLVITMEAVELLQIFNNFQITKPLIIPQKNNEREKNLNSKPHINELIKQVLPLWIPMKQPE
jgi:hypothetical protein